MPERRDKLTILKQRKADADAALAKAAAKTDPLEQAIAIEEERQRREEEAYLGVLVRLLLDDPTVKQKLIEKAILTYPPKAKRPRKALERVLGTLRTAAT